MNFKTGVEDNKSLRNNKYLKFLFSLMCYVNSFHYLDLLTFIFLKEGETSWAGTLGFWIAFKQ